MNARLTLIALLLLVLGGTFKSFAEKFNTFDFGENFEFEKRWRLDRRQDLDSFQTQLDDALNILLSNTASCPTFPCLSGVDKAWCPALCTSNPTLFGQIVSSFANCYFSGICDRNFASIEFANVNISITSGGYIGKCYLYGPQLTIKLINQTNSVTPQSPGMAYNIYEQIYYAFEGLTLYCRPYVPCPTCGTGAVACCGSDLLTRVVCLVQYLVGYLGLNLNLLGCNCYCGGRTLQAPSGSTATPFQIPVTVTQYERFHPFAVYVNGESSVSLATSYAQSTVIYASPVPSDNAGDITRAIERPFNDIATYHTLQYYFCDTIWQMLDGLTSTNYCPSCSS